MGQAAEERIHHIAKQLVETCCEYELTYGRRTMSFPVMSTRQYIKTIVMNGVLPELCKIGAIKYNLPQAIIRVISDATYHVNLEHRGSIKTVSADMEYKSTIAYFTGYLEEIIKGNMEIEDGTR